MTNYTTVLVERETLEKIKKIGQVTRRKNVDVVAIAVELYEKSLKDDEATVLTDPQPIQA